ncbi:unnamed protein product [Pleuronectes platessa]|uniref:Uncharacterized protein n=1 Tax=Pleuronectes platessa TaxID=8262 RepID=A0A9N7Z865_PLEPL|nr:unnamed protein product [Pleuronectes platessa]
MVFLQLCICKFTTKNMEPRLEREPDVCASLGQARTPWGAPCLLPRWARRQGEASRASGKQSGPNWSLTGLTCLHLLEETEDPARPANERCSGPRPSPSLHQHNHTDEQI